MSAAGANRLICRQSSDPIDPPAPAQVSLASIVVQEGDRDVGALRVAQHRRDDLRTRVSRTQHEEPFPPFNRGTAHSLEIVPPYVSRGAHEDEGG